MAALQTTGRWLRFGLGHATSMKFEGGHRSGNCVEYAHLFGTGLEFMARELKIPVEVWVVRSRGARVFGIQPPGRWFADHDWVLVHTGGETLYVDPAFADAWLGWDLRRNVVGSP
jgi:hypothetical protein